MMDPEMKGDKKKMDTSNEGFRQRKILVDIVILPFNCT